jgi:NAD(P)H-flavin reductase
MSALPRVDPWLPRPLRIARVHQEIARVFTLEFETPEGFVFQPGQFNMLYAHGAGEVPISIAGDAAEPDRLVHTIRAVGNVTGVMERLCAGDTVGLRGPYGTAWPMDQARGCDLLFIAGGLGLAPLRPAILHALRHRDAYGRITVLYGARSPDDMLYRAELERWRGRFDLRVEATVDRAGRDWRGPVGVVTRLLDTTPVEPDDAVMMCGPEVMMRFVARALVQRGLPPEALWVSLERSMKCGVGLCGHCQFAGSFVCKDGPVYRYDRVAPLLSVREV